VPPAVTGLGVPASVAVAAPWECADAGAALTSAAQATSTEMTKPRPTQALLQNR
jgi:hypothetical protein